MTKLLSYLVLCITLILVGCVFVDERKMFEMYKNEAVGKVIDREHFPPRPDWVENVGSGRVEYVFRSKSKTGCIYAVEIDEKTRVILGWRYLSEPSLCWQHVPTA